MQLWTAKNFAIFFGLAAIALAISTIVLAVQKAEIQDELNGALDKLKNQESSTAVTASLAPTSAGQTTSGTGTTASIETTSSTQSASSGSTLPPNQTTGDPTDFPWPTLTESTSTSISTSTLTSTSVLTSTTQNPNFPNPNEIVYRLPNHVRPWQYKLYLHPDLKKGTFQGTVSIGLSIDKPTNVIALHSKDLEIFGISILEVQVKMRIRVKDYYTDPVRQLLIIEFHEVLQVYVPYTLSISFRGSLHGLSGFYSSSYIDQQGEQT